MTFTGTVLAQRKRQEPRSRVGAGGHEVGVTLSKQNLSICCVKEMTGKEWKLKGNLETN